MKKQLCLNRRLYLLDLCEQNIYLGNKLDSMKPMIKSGRYSSFSRKGYINHFSKNKSK